MLAYIALRYGRVTLAVARLTRADSPRPVSGIGPWGRALFGVIMLAVAVMITLPFFIFMFIAYPAFGVVSGFPLVTAWTTWGMGGVATAQLFLPIVGMIVGYVMDGLADTSLAYVPLREQWREQYRRVHPDWKAGA